MTEDDRKYNKVVKVMADAFQEAKGILHETAVATNYTVKSFIAISTIICKFDTQ